MVLLLLAELDVADRNDACYVYTVNHKQVAVHLWA